MKLSSQQTSLLAVVEFEALRPLAEVARQLKQRESTVRYTMSTLIENKVIVRRRAYINSYLLGFQNFALYFSLALSETAERQKLIKKLVSNPRITWFAELAGDFQYALSYSARHVEEVVEFLATLPSVQGNASVLSNRSISLRASIRSFPRKYLGMKNPSVKEFLQGGQQAVALDDVDNKILSALARSQFESLRQLALQSDIPASTFERRLNKLEKSGVVQGHYFVLDAAQFSMHEFRLLINSQGVNQTTRSALLGFARQNPLVRKFIECIGAWDYELEVAVPTMRQITEFVGLINERFAGCFSSIRVVPLLNEISCSPFPDASG